MTSRSLEYRLILGIGLVLAILFVTHPEIDLAVSRHFYAGDGVWRYNSSDFWAALPNLWVPRIGRGVLALLILIALIGRFRPDFVPPATRDSVAFLLIAALLGPVVGVEAIKTLAERARPSDITTFGGERTFSPAFRPAGQCARNCSFVSGHAATAAFLLLAPGWRRRRRLPWLFLAIVATACVGLARIAVSAHFLSDVVFAWYTSYVALWLSETLCRRRWRHSHELRPPALPPPSASN
jgi:membrane-associated phospholipid phosphatase